MTATATPLLPSSVHSVNDEREDHIWQDKPPSPLFKPSCNTDGKSKLRIVTLPLLRKRSEHNEGLVSSLEEMALHQEELQSIGPLLGRTCGKTLKILLLQNNVIARMDPKDLKFFRSLEYLNLALNNITKVEGVSGMEWLRKLDLTLNFVGLDSIEESVDELAGCRSLEELFLLGNPCMGLGSNVIPPATDANGDHSTASSSPQKQVAGWKGCRAYVIARLPNLQLLDGKEIKRSERILAMQQLPTLVSELHSLAETRRKELQLERLKQQQNSQVTNEAVDESYIADEAPTHHNPETRTKLSNELYDQKQAKEKLETAQHAPKPKGEKEWDQEHKYTVQKAREREERGREWQSGSNQTTTYHWRDGYMRTKKDEGIKQCNQGKYQFWFEEESVKDATGQKSVALIMRVAVPKHLSTSLIDADIHPTYVSIVIKSKILRVILPAEVCSDKSLARRSAASGYLELIMPKANVDEVLVGLGHFRERQGRDNLRPVKKLGISRNQQLTTEAEIKENKMPKKGERLGQSIMNEAGMIGSLKFVSSRDSDEANGVLSSSDDEDDPPPLF